jgi:hypothetical protein
VRDGAPCVTFRLPASIHAPRFARKFGFDYCEECGGKTYDPEVGHLRCACEFTDEEQWAGECKDFADYERARL